MRYKNVITGVVIETESEVSGRNWVEVKEAEKPPAAPTKKGKQVRPDAR